MIDHVAVLAGHFFEKSGRVFAELGQNADEEMALWPWRLDHYEAASLGHDYSERDYCYCCCCCCCQKLLGLIGRGDGGLPFFRRQHDLSSGGGGASDGATRTDTVNWLSDLPLKMPLVGGTSA